MWHKLIPDCRQLVFQYYTHKSASDSSVEGPLQPYETLSDARFALKYFENWHFNKNADVKAYFDPEIIKNAENDKSNSKYYMLPLESGRKRRVSCSNITESVFQYFQNLHSLILSGSCSWIPESFIFLKNVKELQLVCCDSLTNEALQQLESLEKLHVATSNDDGIGDAAFINMGHLKQLDLIYCPAVTDRAIENLYDAGSRLEHLNIMRCSQITDRALSFLEESIKTIRMYNCPRITKAGWKYVSGCIRSVCVDSCQELITRSDMHHLRGVEKLSLREIREENSRNIDCRELFKLLGDSLLYLDASASNLDSFDEESFRHLKGLVSLTLRHSTVENLTDDAFQHLSGTIKYLDLSNCKAKHLSKNLLLHLDGIRNLDISNTDIWRIESEDLPRLKQVFQNIESFCASREAFWSPAVHKLCKFIRKKEGTIEVD